VPLGEINLCLNFDFDRPIHPPLGHTEILHQANEVGHLDGRVRRRGRAVAKLGESGFVQWVWLVGGEVADGLGGGRGGQCGDGQGRRTVGSGGRKK
jgi:hypothetical protein